MGIDNNKKKKYILRKGDSNMLAFADFMKANKEKIYALAEANTPKNDNNTPVITKDDPWRNEKEWDEVYGDEY